MAEYTVTYAVMFAISVLMFFLWGMYRNNGDPYVHIMMGVSVLCAVLSLVALILSLY